MPAPSLPPCGIDRLLADPGRLRGRRAGLLANQASLTARFEPTAQALAAVPGGALVRLFSPEHGWSGFAAAGDAVADAREPVTGLPVVSLYGPRRTPDAGHLEDLDVVIVDLQDVGVRCYTYAATAARLAAAAVACGVEVIVCDRPNPLGGDAEGPDLDPSLRSLVAWFDTPFRHGRTLGALLDGATVIAADADWPPHRPWIPASPGLPDLEAVRLYPALVLLEGTGVSEGRGTTLPFRCAAAPGLDGSALARRINAWDAGVAARPIRYVPAAGRCAGETCDGVQLFAAAPLAAPVAFGVRLLAALRELLADFRWIGDDSGWWIDSLLGDRSLREGLDAGMAPEAILARWPTRRRAPDRRR